MKRKRTKGQRSMKDEEVHDYEGSESEGLDPEEQDLLDNAVGRRSQGGEEEVLRVYSSSGESEEEVGGGDEGLPDPRAWGPDRRHYYHTDYVDKDYLGFDDEAAAEAEEAEAAAVQRRLLTRLHGVDFSLGLFQQIEERQGEAEEPRDAAVTVDLEALSAAELRHLLHRETPHLLPILSHSTKYVNYLKKLVPVLRLLEEECWGECGAVLAARLLYSLILQYSVNVLLLVHLEEGGEGGGSHPVLRRIAGCRLLLEELQPVMDRLGPQLAWIEEALARGERPHFHSPPPQPLPPPNNRKERRKRKLELLKKREVEKALVENKKRKLMRLEEVLERGDEEGRPEAEVGRPEADDRSEQEALSGGEESEDDGEEMQKRGVTFQMLKNKGLTPRRKKENRNPRVKHRNKFRRALKRRRGQIREPRKEVDKYAGEISGIKKYISKSIKLK